MATNPNEIAHDMSPLLVIYKDGRVERLIGNDLTPPSLDPQTGVESKDIVISPETALVVRIYKPRTTSIPQPQKLPLLVYFHGGGFCIETAFSPVYHNHLNSLVAEANVIAVSVDYRRAPEHPLPTAHNDSWAALKWVAAHSNGNGQEEWLNSLADFDRLFLAGDSAGGNMAHHMAMRVGTDPEGLKGAKLRALILVHPYFWGKKSVGDEEKLDAKGRSVIEGLWYLSCPTISGLDDPLINPDCDPNLGRLGGERVVVCVAEKDALKDRGWLYRESLKKAGWSGAVEVEETKGQEHVFHLFNPSSEIAVEFVKKLAGFINGK